MFIDASAIVAMLLAEPDSDHLAEKVERAPTKVTSAIAIWESITRLSRDHDPKVARHRVFKLLDDAGASVVTIGTEEARIASLARDRYGSGKYGLNMGDCFAYIIH